MAGGPGFVAVGRSFPCCADTSYDDEGWEVAIWTSADGVEWTVVPDLASFGKAGLTAIDRSDEGLLVAVGYDVGPAPSAGEPVEMRGSAWSSTNGVDWLALAPPAGEYQDVTWTTSGWLIAGAADGRPAIFSSSDLREWSAHTFDGYGRVSTLAASGDGRILAVGCADNDPGVHCSPMTWTDADGQWERIEIAASTIYTATVWQGQFVVAGMTAGDVPRGTSWVLADDDRWENAGTPDGIGDVLALFSDGDRLIAAGSSDKVFESSDGLRWSPLAELEMPEGAPEGIVHYLLPTPGGIVGLGEAFVAGATPYVWMEPD